MLQIVASLTDDSRGVIYDGNLFIVQATDLLILSKLIKYNEDFFPIFSLPALTAAPRLKPLTLGWRGEYSTTVLSPLANEMKLLSMEECLK
jgi:hypothetical protein